MHTSIKHSKSLKKSTFMCFFALSLGVIILTSILFVLASWQVYEGNAEHQLTEQAQGMAHDLEGLSNKELVYKVSGMSLEPNRVTLVARDGTVLFDNQLDSSLMENHSNREEIEAALAGKTKVVFRHSASTKIDTLYACAPILHADAVIRIAQNRTSLFAYLETLALPFLLIVCIAGFLCYWVSRLLTLRIVRPLVTIDLDHPSEKSTYKELKPLLNRIKSQRADLIVKNNQLEEAMKIRREFTSNVSHEMKTPLQVISGYAELIENGMTKKGDAKKFAGLIHEEAQSMRALIDDVLILSRLEESASDDGVIINLAEVVDRVLNRFEMRFEEEKIHIEKDLDDSLVIKASPLALEQVVYNLVDNAIRYSGAYAHIKVSIKQTDIDIRLLVSDDGPGIPPEAQTRVFERFYRVDASRSRQTGGTGLGLAIVKHIAESLGGSACVADALLGGTTIQISLPKNVSVK